MKKEKLFTVAFISLLLLGIALFGYNLVSSVQAEEASQQGTVSGKLVLPDGITMPAGMKVGLFHIDYEAPPHPSENPIPPYIPTPTPSIPPPPPVPLLGSDLERPSAPNLAELAPLPPLEENVYGPPVVTAIVDTNSGEFSFDSIYSGVYVLHLLPPEGSYLMAAAPPYVDLFQSSVDLGDIRVSVAQVAGDVIAPGSDSLVEGYVFLKSRTGSYLASTRTVSGRYFMQGIPAGDYSLSAYPSPDQNEHFESDPIAVTIEDEGETIVHSIEYAGPDIYGTVLDADGNPYPDSDVGIYSIDGLPYVSGYAYSDSQGRWQIGNLRDGQYEIVVSNYRDYDGSDLLPPNPLQITIPTDELPIELKYNQWPDRLKVVSGHVVDQNGIPVTDGRLVASHQSRGLSRSTTTDENGRYELSLVGGDWIVELYPINYEVRDWHNIEPYTLVSFALDETSEEKQISFEVARFDAAVRGSVASTDPAIATGGYYVSIFSNSTYFENNGYFPQGSPFELAAPAGEYVYQIYPDAEGLAPLIGKTIILKSGELLDLGEVLLQAPNASIRGTVTTSSGNPVPNVHIYAYNNDGLDRDRFATTDADGNYELRAIAGNWTVYAEIYHLPEFYYNDGPVQATVAEGESADGVNFVLQELNSRISASLVNQAGDLLSTINGYATVVKESEPSYYGESHISGGRFEIPVLPGDYELYLGVYDSPYMFPANISITVAPDSTLNVEIKALEPNALITGQVVDFRTGETIPNVAGEVRAYSNSISSGIGTSITADDSSFDLPVVAGEWFIDWWIPLPNNPDYYPINSTSNSLFVTENSTVTLDLPLLFADASISGSLNYPPNDFAPYGHLVLQGLDELTEFYLTIDTDMAGNFSANVPYGSYLLTAYDSFGDDDMFPPDPIVITLEPGEALAGLELNFRAAETPLSGSVYAPGLTESVEAFVSLNLAGGSYKYFGVNLTSDGENAVGDFSVDIVDGSWFIDVYAYTEDEHWHMGGSIDVDGPTQIDLILNEGEYYLPPESAEMDDDQPVTVQLSDGTAVVAPAGLLADDVPVRHVGLETGNFFVLNGDLQPVALTYQVMAFDSNMSAHWEKSIDQTLTVTVPYPSYIEDVMDPADLVIMIQSVPDARINADPTVVDDITLDTENRTITFQMDRLGYFGVMAPAEMLPSTPSFADIFGNKSYFSFISR